MTDIDPDHIFKGPTFLFIKMLNWPNNLKSSYFASTFSKLVVLFFFKIFAARNFYSFSMEFLLDNNLMKNSNSSKTVLHEMNGF